MNYFLLSASIVLPNACPLQPIVNCWEPFSRIRFNCSWCGEDPNQISTRFSADLVEEQEARTIFVQEFFHVKAATKYIISKKIRLIGHFNKGRIGWAKKIHLQ